MMSALRRICVLSFLLLGSYHLVCSNPCSQQILRLRGGQAQTTNGSYGCVNCCTVQDIQTHVIAQIGTRGTQEARIRLDPGDCTQPGAVRLVFLSWTPVRWVLQDITNINLQKIYVFQTIQYVDQNSSITGVPDDHWSFHQDIQFDVLNWPQYVNTTLVGPLLDELRDKYGLDPVSSVNLWAWPTDWTVNIGGACCLTAKGNDTLQPEVCESKEDRPRSRLIGPFTLPILIAVVLVSVVVFLLFLVLICWCCSKRKKKEDSPTPTPVVNDRVSQWVTDVAEQGDDFSDVGSRAAPYSSTQSPKSIKEPYYKAHIDRNQRTYVNTKDDIRFSTKVPVR